MNEIESMRVLLNEVSEKIKKLDKENPNMSCEEMRTELNKFILINSKSIKYQENLKEIYSEAFEEIRKIRPKPIIYKCVFDKDRVCDNSCVGYSYKMQNKRAGEKEMISIEPFCGRGNFQIMKEK